jgi:hypothetical protein
MNSATKPTCKFDLDAMFLIVRNGAFYGIIPIKTVRDVSQQEMATLRYAIGVKEMKEDREFAAKCEEKGVQEYRAQLDVEERRKISQDTAYHIGEANLLKLVNREFNLF